METTIKELRRPQVIPNMGYISFPINEGIAQSIKSTKTLGDFLYQHYLNQNYILVCRGASGIGVALLVATYIYNTYDKEIDVQLLRKDNENCHDSSDSKIRAKYLDNYKIVIVDDLIDSGETVIKLYNDLKRILKDENLIIDSIAVGTCYGHTTDALKDVKFNYLFHKEC